MPLDIPKLQKVQMYFSITMPFYKIKTFKTYDILKFIPSCYYCYNRNIGDVKIRQTKEDLNLTSILETIHSFKNILCSLLAKNKVKNFFNENPIGFSKCAFCEVYV